MTRLGFLDIVNVAWWLANWCCVDRVSEAASIRRLALLLLRWLAASSPCLACAWQTKHPELQCNTLF